MNLITIFREKYTWLLPWIRLQFGAEYTRDKSQKCLPKSTLEILFFRSDMCVCSHFWVLGVVQLPLVAVKFKAKSLSSPLTICQQAQKFPSGRNNKYTPQKLKPSEIGVSISLFVCLGMVVRSLEPELDSCQDNQKEFKPQQKNDTLNPTTSATCSVFSLWIKLML